MIRKKLLNFDRLEWRYLLRHKNFVFSKIDYKKTEGGLLLTAIFKNEKKNSQQCDKSLNEF